MAVPTKTIWKCDPHTVAKHQILQRYLEAWYPILISRFSSVTYAEGFAGSGIYEDGHPGSPVIAAGVFLRRRNLLAGKTVKMVLVEERKRRINQLKQEMTSACGRYGPPPPELEVSFREGRCGHDLLPALASAGSRGAPIFAFLDSFGGPDVPLAVARAIASQPSSEVLVTFGTNFLTRFGTKDKYQQAGDDAFGGTSWREVHGLPSGEKKRFLVDTYRNSLKAAGFTYVVSFEMVDEKGADLHLVFGTGNRKGLEKMKDAMWKVDPVRGVHYRDPRDPDQMMLDFDLNPHLDPLIQLLTRELAHGERSLAELRDYTLLETVYRVPHANSAVREMLGKGLIERDPRSGQLTGTTRIKLTATGRKRLAGPEQTLF